VPGDARRVLCTAYKEFVMADLISLRAEPRASEHKGALRRLRREGHIPGILYGKKLEPQLVQVSGRDLQHALRGHGQSALLELSVAGERVTAVIKEVQHDPVSGRLSHLAFQRVSLADQITAQVPLIFTGDTTAITDVGGVIEHPASEVTVSCRADHLPESITVDLSNLALGESMRVGDIIPPDGVEIVTNPDQVVVATSVSAAAREEASAEAAAAAEVAAAVETPAAEEAAGAES
jgi:large subunit ribosomal protein L25